jgi:hypothetical protein
VIRGVVIVVFIGELLIELLDKVGVNGKKYKSPPAGPSIPIMVGDEGVRRPVCLYSGSIFGAAIAGGFK